MKKSKTNVKKNEPRSSTPTIQQFFKSTPKLVDARKSKDDDETKEFYVQFLKEKIQECENDAATTGNEPDNELELYGASSVVNKVMIGSADVGENSMATEKGVKYTDAAVQTNHCTGCTDWETKYKTLKKDYMKIATNYAELRLKYDDRSNATKAFIHNNPPDSNDEASTSGAFFTSAEILILENMSLKKQTDSTFILKSLKFAYKDNLSVLRDRTLKGKSEAVIFNDNGEVAYTPGKDPLTPLKVEKLRELFVKRIDKCNLKPTAYEERIREAYMNKLIASAITNISKAPLKD